MDPSRTADTELQTNVKNALAEPASSQASGNVTAMAGEPDTHGSAAAPPSIEFATLV